VRHGCHQRATGEYHGIYEGEGYFDAKEQDAFSVVVLGFVGTMVV